MTFLERLRNWAEGRYCFRCGSKLQWEDRPHEFSPTTGKSIYAGFLYCPEQDLGYSWRMNIDGKTRYSDDHEARSLRKQPAWAAIAAAYAAEGEGEQE